MPRTPKSDSPRELIKPFVPLKDSANALARVMFLTVKPWRDAVGQRYCEWRDDAERCWRDSTPPIKVRRTSRRLKKRRPSSERRSFRRQQLLDRLRAEAPDE